jgi:drug/metabolite transporter (DMT)-like permease
MLGALSFGMLAVVSKLAERRYANPSVLVVTLCGWAAILMAGRTLVQPGSSFVTWPVAGIAIVFGICGAVAYLAFQTSITRGKVTVGWLMMNLSAGVPAAVSIWLYRERLTLRKEIAFSLAIIALFCLFRGNQLEARQTSEGAS